MSSGSLSREARGSGLSSSMSGGGAIFSEGMEDLSWTWKARPCRSNMGSFRILSEDLARIPEKLLAEEWGPVVSISFRLDQDGGGVVFLMFSKISVIVPSERVE